MKPWKDFLGNIFCRKMRFLFSFIGFFPLIISIAGCDQSVVAPLSGPKVTELAWNEAELNSHFMTTFHGHWLGSCMGASKGSIQYSLLLKPHNLGSLSMQSFSDLNCEKKSTHKRKYFTFKVLRAWELNNRPTWYETKFSFTDNLEGEVSEYYSTFYLNGLRVFEQRFNIVGIEKGFDTFKGDPYWGEYFREEED
jgi:hypothetical protein